jgi:2-polyprenyl-3-methyl-5-hydroxy-6-metoxy-1,4-benzoquinol methylase
MIPHLTNPIDSLKYLMTRIEYLNNDIFHNIAIKTLNYYKGSKQQRNQTSLFQKIELEWYESLKNNNPIYHYYSKPEMVIETWACFYVYSKKYLNLIEKLKLDIYNYKTVVDLGCGVGFTTSYLKYIFKNSNVYGTNVRGYQWNIATELGQKNGFSIIESVKELNNIDIIFASEYFEHFEYPIDHLLTILEKKPKLMFIANAFGSQSFGHFNEYKYESEIYSNKNIGKLFNITLKKHGYQQVKCGFWNNRPAVWKLK